MNLFTNSNHSYVHVYFQVHQPRRIRPLPFLEIGSKQSLFNDTLNCEIIRRVSKNCYLPTNLLLLQLLRKYPQLKITFSISGTALEQMEEYAPAALESFRMLANTGSVEFLGETYYHSLAFLHNRDEFIDQIDQHSKTIQALLHVTPAVFRNTELIYNDEIGRVVSHLGFKGILLDGVDRLHTSAHHVYDHPNGKLKLLLRHYHLSDDIAFRYSDRKWREWPLTSAKFLKKLNLSSGKESLINLGMDYETFGEHQSASTGIHIFLEEMLRGILEQKKFKVVSATEAVQSLQSTQQLFIPNYISWADQERDLSAWLGNDMQREAFELLYSLEQEVRQTGNPELLTTWRYLQTSDHFYYISTKTDSDGLVHSYFNPYSSPHEAFINFMNVLTDFELRIRSAKKNAIGENKNGAHSFCVKF
jgi:alpha-amylase